jgi:hypothetical protein
LVWFFFLNNCHQDYTSIVIFTDDFKQIRIKLKHRIVDRNQGQFVVIF